MSIITYQDSVSDFSRDIEKISIALPHEFFTQRMAGKNQRFTIAEFLSLRVDWSEKRPGVFVMHVRNDLPENNLAIHDYANVDCRFSPAESPGVYAVLTREVCDVRWLADIDNDSVFTLGKVISLWRPVEKNRNGSGYVPIVDANPLLDSRQARSAAEGAS